MSSYNFTKWGIHHKKIAEKYLKNNQRLDNLPEDIFDWVDTARPKVEGKKRSFLAAPYWVPIYEDECDFQMIMGGRQIFKSTSCTDFIAAKATSHPGIQVCYVTHNEKNLSAFSKQKLKIGTFLVNHKLRKFLRNPGNVGEISLKNNSTIYLVTDNDRYIHLEGKSPDLCVLDEAQYQDLEYFGRIRQTMMRTKGKIKIFGIGGEAGSHYEKLWKSTNQMEWIYDDPNWREKLRFGYAELNEDEGEYFFEGTQLIIGNYLNTVLKGRWVRPDGVEDNEFFHGYHIPQTISPIIPLTEDDAITKYKTHPSFSIEHQKKNQPMSEFLSHSMGTFYNSEYRSITAEMINLCTEPYRNKSLLTPDDVIHLKKTFGEEIVIGMGVDFGSGGASSTVIAILIWWRRSDRIQLAYIKKRERENQAGQAEEILSLFKKYHCDIGVGDLGYAPNQVKLIQDGGYGINGGESYEGVGKNNFIGCRSISDVTKPFQIFDDTIDEHGEQTGRVQIDKTWGVDQFIELVSRSVMLEDKKCSKLIIPYKNDYEVSFLLEDMYKISRKDLKDIEDKIDTRQHPRKEYNHPPDSVMAVIYGMISFKVKKGSEWFYVSG